MTLSLPKRIDLELFDGPISYGDLARRLWPNESAWRYSRNGGPPGCYMALSAAINRGNFLLGLPRNGSNASRLVYPRITPAVSGKDQTGGGAC